MLWFEGSLYPTGPVPFDLADRGLLLGDGVFDTSLVLGGAMVWRTAHLARLASACEALDLPFDRSRVDEAVDALVTRCPEGALRITVTRGAGPRGIAPPLALRPAVIASLAPGRPAAFAPISLHVSAIRRNETSPTARLKTLGYLDAVLATRDALRAGFDDAVFLNTAGRVACAAAGNLAALIGGMLVTPPLDDGVLAGIARATLLRLGAAGGLAVAERSLTLADLAAAEAVFVTGSLKLLAPVLRIGTTVLPPRNHVAIELTEAMAAAIRAECGVDPRLR